jgi:predicted MFS family arabinose efflux permease
LAFAFHEAQAGLLDFGAVLAAAGVGFAIASLAAPHLERRLREEPMVVAALAVEAGAAFSAGQWFELPTAAALAAAAGFAWGTAKLAFDGLLQSNVPHARRGAAFTRSETLFAIAWVLGAIIPTALPMPTGLGLALAGFAALGAQIVYVGALLVPRDTHRDAHDEREPP